MFRPGVVMANLHVREPFAVSLTKFSDLTPGEKNLLVFIVLSLIISSCSPVTGLVVAIDSYGVEIVNLAVMLEEGIVVTLIVQEQLWTDSWKSQVKHGQVCCICFNQFCR